MILYIYMYRPIPQSVIVSTRSNGFQIYSLSTSYNFLHRLPSVKYFNTLNTITTETNRQQDALWGEILGLVRSILTTSIICERARPNVTLSGSDVLLGMTGRTLLSYPFRRSLTSRCSFVSSRRIPEIKNTRNRTWA